MNYFYWSRDGCKRFVHFISFCFFPPSLVAVMMIHHCLLSQSTQWFSRDSHLLCHCQGIAYEQQGNILNGSILIANPFRWSNNSDLNLTDFPRKGSLEPRFRGNGKSQAISVWKSRLVKYFVPCKANFWNSQTG